MPDNRRKLQAGLAALVAFSLFVCMLTGGASARAPGRQIGGFTFTPHVTDVGATPIPGVAVVPTPDSGQYFEEDDPNRPEVLREAGDDWFGYGALASNPDLYAIWVTDETGTHYLIVESDSDLIWGDTDRQGERLGNGLDGLIQQRSSLLNQIAELVGLSESRDNTSGTLFQIGIGGLILAGICVAATLGGCGVVLGAAGAFLAPAFVIQGDARENDTQVEVLATQLHDLEQLIRNRFAVGLARTGTP